MVGARQADYKRWHIGRSMDLREIINNVENISNELVIFATKGNNWLVDAPAALVLASDMEQVASLEGLVYFLEVETAKDVLEVWKHWRAGRDPSEAERIDALLFYADNDAFLKVI